MTATATPQATDAAGLLRPARVHQLSQAETLKHYATQRITKDGQVLEVSLTLTALLNAAGQMYAISTTERSKDIVQAQAPGTIDGTPS